MLNDPHWTSYLTALITPTVAALGLWIALQQLQTARSKLKLDLFDRRIAVYQSIMEFIGSILTTGKVKEEERFKYLQATRDARWLFGDEIVSYIDVDIHKRAVELQYLNGELHGVPVSDERSSNVRKQSELKKWFNEQFSTGSAMFAKYMKLDV